MKHERRGDHCHACSKERCEVVPWPCRAATSDDQTLTVQAAYRALGLPAETVGITIEHRCAMHLQRWEVRQLDSDGSPMSGWVVA